MTYILHFKKSITTTTFLYPTVSEFNYGKKSQIQLDCIIQSISNVFKSSGYVEMQLKLYVRWIDPRLVYKYISKEEKAYRKNRISAKQLPLIWLPTIILNNTRSKSSIELADQRSAGIIHVKEGATERKSPVNDLFNYPMYRGHEG